MSSEIVMVVSDASALAGKLTDSPLIFEVGSMTVIMPPVAAGIRADATTRLPKTDRVKL